MSQPCAGRCTNSTSNLHHEPMRQILQGPFLREKTKARVFNGLDRNRTAAKQQSGVLKPTLHVTAPAALIRTLRSQKPLQARARSRWG